MFSQLISNTTLWIAVVCWLTAQVLKVILYSIHTKKFAIERLVGAGGMPSSHSSTVCGLSVAVARVYGLQSPLFTISIVLACIVMYDATGVRRAAGEHAKLLNQLLFSGETDLTPSRKVLKEFLGHTPLEVLGGAILGVVLGLVMPI